MALRWDARFRATACNCTACRRYGALWAYGFEGVGIDVSGSTPTYTRGKCRFSLLPRMWLRRVSRYLETSSRGQRAIGVNLRLTDPESVEAIAITITTGSRPLGTCPEMDDVLQTIGSESPLAARVICLREHNQTFDAWSIQPSPSK
jgi:hypothetical protein